MIRQFSLGQRSGISPAGWSLAVLAAAFQFMITPAFGGNPIRLSAADVIMPVLLATALWQWLGGRAPRPAVVLPRIWLWLAALTLWLCVSLIIGRLATDEWQKWALVNKFCGWFALCGFLAIGIWTAQWADRQHRDLFARALCATAVIISVLDSLLYVVLQVVDLRLLPRLTGWAGNPNSFGYLLAVVTVAVLPIIKRGRLFGPRLDPWSIGMMMAALLFSGSRSAWVGIVCGLAVLWLLEELPWQAVVRGLILGALLAALVSALSWTAKLLFKDLIVFSPYFLRDSMLYDSGINHRWRITLDAITMWREHPFLGIGLGTFYWADTARYPDPSTIHNSALWLLCETGLIGLGLFAAFLVAIGRALLRALRAVRPDPLAVGGGAALAVMVGASVGMEAIYQRHVWFLVGYALSACLREPAVD